MTAFRYGAFVMAASGVAVASSVSAQTETIIIPSTIPFDYDRGRNVSVLERPRPEYDPLGVRSGSILIYPRIELGAGYTDNVFITEGPEESDGYALVAPSIRAQSDWSRHALSLSANGRFRRYFDATARNEDVYNVRALGRVDVDSSFSLTGEAQIGRLYESPFTTGSDSALAGISNYDYNQQGLRGTYAEGRAKLTLAYARNEYDFNEIELGNGVSINQSDRDREINSLVLQGEYAMSPAVSTFGQISVADTDYDRLLLNGQANRDSKGYRALAGVNFDLSALMRGSVGIGYTWREYNSPIYDDVDGFSTEIQLEYFPTQLTTVTFGARRVIEDSNFTSNGAYFDNRLTLRVDREVRQNIILNVNGSYSYQNYVNSDRTTNIYQLGAGGDYLFNRNVSARFNTSYRKRERDGTAFQGELDEFLALASLVFQI